VTYPFEAIPVTRWEDDVVPNPMAGWGYTPDGRRLVLYDDFERLSGRLEALILAHWEDGVVPEPFMALMRERRANS
jgi:hypothetical protein